MKTIYEPFGFRSALALHLFLASRAIAGLLLTSGCAASATDTPSTPAELMELRGEFQVISEPTRSGATLTAYGLVNEQFDWVLLSVEGLELPPSGSQVELSGSWIDPSTFEVDAIERLPELKGFFTDPPERPAQTHHNVIVMVAGDVASTESQRADLRTKIRDAMAQVSALYASVTHGVDTFELGLGTTPGYTNEPGIYFSDVTVAGTSGCRYGSSKPITAMREEFVAQDRGTKTEEQLQAELDQYEHTVAVVPNECLGGWLGWGVLGRVDRDGKLDIADRVAVSQDSIDVGTLAHELGHNLGLSHAQAYECEDFFLPYLGGCESRSRVPGPYFNGNYGNNNDIMGFGEDTWFMTPTMRRLGWLPADRVETRLEAGTWEFELTPMDSGRLNGTQAIRVPVHGENYTTFFYLEYRRPSDNPYSGVQVGHTREPTVLLTYADDVTGLNARLELDTGRYLGLAVGRSYTIGSGEHEVRVTVHSMDETARVEVMTKEAPGRDPLCADGVSHPNQTQLEAWRAGSRGGAPECGCPDPDGGVCLVHLNAGIDDAPQSRVQIGYSGVTASAIPDGFPRDFAEAPDDPFSDLSGFFIEVENPHSSTEIREIGMQSEASSISSRSFARLPEGHYQASLFARWYEEVDTEEGVIKHEVLMQRLRISIGEPDPQFIRFQEVVDPRPYEEIVANSFVLQKFEVLLLLSGLQEELADRTHTLFPPWDPAFDNDPPPYWRRMTSGRQWFGHLRNLLMGHIHVGSLPEAALIQGDLVLMMDGQTRDVDRDPHPRVDEVLILASVAARDAHMHMLDRPLAPAWADQTIMDVLAGDEDERFSKLKALLDLEELGDHHARLSDRDAGLTLFAPTNAALEDTPLDGCTGGACVEAVRRMLDAHVVERVTPRRYTSEGPLARAPDGSFSSCWNPEAGTVSCTDAHGQEHVTPVGDEVYAVNGILHPVDALLCSP